MSSHTAPFTLLFIGDSITDAGRREDPEGLGNGFVRLISERLAASAPGVRVLNRGIGGDRSRDLLARIDADCIAHAPDLVSVLVGINDTWRRFDSNDPTELERFAHDYRTMLTQIREQTDAQLVLCEPFLVPMDEAQQSFRIDLDPKIAVVRKLAADFDAILIRVDSLLQQHAAIVGQERVAPDGVHPNTYGHHVLADAWMRTAASALPLISPSLTLSGFGDEIDDDPRVQAAVLSALGASAIEVRSAWGVNIVDLTPHQLGELKTIFDGAGLHVSAIASPIGKVNIADHSAEQERLQRAIVAARTLGTHSIRVFSFYPRDGAHPDADRADIVSAMRVLAEIAEREGATLLHENEKHIYGDIPERVLRLVAEVDSPAFKLAWDSANYVQVGVVPDDDTIALLSPWTDYLQIKDATLEDAVVRAAGEGDGAVDLVTKRLLQRGYRGVASLEPHLSSAFDTGGFSGPAAFGLAARAFRAIAEREGVVLT